MIIFYVLFTAVFIGVLLARFGDYNWEIVGEFTVAVSVVIIFLMTLYLPLQRMETQSRIHEFIAIAETLKNARERSDAAEGVAFRLKIAEANAWLARTKYWRTTTFYIYIPAEIDDLKPIH